MISPCTKVCHIDPTNEVCIGCFRTLEEIVKWQQMSDQERITVTNSLEKRKNDYMGNLSQQP